MSGGRGPFSLSGLPASFSSSSSPRAWSAPGARPRGPVGAGASQCGAPGDSRIALALTPDQTFHPRVGVGVGAD